MAHQRRTLPKPTLEEVLADIHTKAAFDFLVSRNASPNELWSHLLLAIMTLQLRESPHVLSVEGMTRYQLKEFPANLRRIARCIRIIEDNPQLESTGPKKTETNLLVDALSRYADRLESDIKYYRKFMAKNPAYGNLRSVFVLKLLDYVAKATGKPHFEKVSTLLVGGGAAGIAPDEKAIVDVDPDALRKLFRRRSPEKINRV